MLLKRTLTLFIIVLLVIGALSYFVSAYIWIRPSGVWLNSKIIIIFEDGSQLVVSSESKNILTDTLTKFSVLTVRGKKLKEISVDIYAVYGVTPRDKKLAVQDWFQFYIQLDGIYAEGLREYDPLTGFTDIFYTSYDDSEQTSRWILLYNNPGASWTGVTDFVQYFYIESGTGLQLGLLNIGPEFAYDIVQALSGNMITERLASKLTALLGIREYGDGDREDIIEWTMAGWDFYSYLKRMDWKGLAIHLGSFTIGLGKWLRMHDGDIYTITFKVAYFYRWRDVTGEWSEWRAGEIEIGTLELKVEEGCWYVLDININNSVDIQT